MKLRDLEIALAGLLGLIVVFVWASSLYKVMPASPVVKNIVITPQVVVAAKKPGSFSSISFGTTTLNLLIADNDALREKGLGDRLTLPGDQAMLFIFPDSDIYPFWMKDMHFSLDIIWLDEKCTIVYAKENLSPATYPAIYSPNTPARYVLETNAGFLQKNHLKIGDGCALF